VIIASRGKADFLLAFWGAQMRITQIFAILIVFGLGWMLNDAFSIGLEQPGVISGSSIYPITPERASPSDIVPQDNIHVYSDKIVIEVDNPQWATFVDSNSMDPVFDKGANALQIVPTDPEQIQAGDIISFSVDYDSGVIIHRVIETAYDDDGWYAITKGDNNAYKDPGKVRFENVKKQLIGIIY